MPLHFQDRVRDLVLSMWVLGIYLHQQGNSSIKVHCKQAKDFYNYEKEYAVNNSFRKTVSLSVYPWRNFSLLLITFNSTTGTPLKGSYTVTLNSLGLVEGNATTLPSTLLSLPKPREQCPSSVREIINKNYFSNTI